MNGLQHYRKLVDPEAPAIRQILEPLLRGGLLTLSKDILLDTVIDCFKGFRYVWRAGWQSFDEVLQNQAGNCLTLACLLCSALRASKFTEEEVFVALVAPPLINMDQTAFSNEPHAYVFLWRKDPLIINPNDMGRHLLKDPQVQDLLEHFEEQLPLFIFNDRICRLLSMKIVKHFVRSLIGGD